MTDRLALGHDLLKDFGGKPFGSKADLTARRADFRFTGESGLTSDMSSISLGAIDFPVCFVGAA